MKKLSILIGILLVLSIIPLVSAQPAPGVQPLTAPNLGFDPITGIVEGFINVINRLGSSTVTMPIYGHTVTYLHLFLTWLIMFTLIWVASGIIPPFNTSEGKRTPGARKTFAVAVSLLVTFGSPLAYYLYLFITTWFSLVMIILLIILFWGLLVWVGRVRSHFGKTSAGSKLLDAESGKTRNLARRKQQDETLASDIMDREESSIEELKKLAAEEEFDSRRLIDLLRKLKAALTEAKGVEGEEATKEVSRLMGIISQLVKYESREQEIIKKQEEITGTIEKYGLEEIQNLKRDEIDEKKLIEELKDRKDIKDEKREEYARDLITHALNQSLAIKNLTEEFVRVEDFKEKELGLARQYTQNLVDSLRTTPPNFDNSIMWTDRLIGVVNKEVNIENSAMKILTNLKKFADTDFEYIKRARSVS
ncbi:MAG: hypothetical protein ISS25_01815 [Nanoarchaeota archaeon]|nr:hypothetical protein [DPANN group archaeon]MBL7116542.1 hypothetical protein [Nanoarchaeota archaeon]